MVEERENIAPSTADEAAGTQYSDPCIRMPYVSCAYMAAYAVPNNQKHSSQNVVSKLRNT